MGFASAPGNDHRRPLTEINMIPLIDVMLVLLIVFMITAPLLTHAVRIDLPQASSSVDHRRPEQIDLALKANGDTWWQEQPVDRAELTRRLQAATRQTPPPELRLRADASTPYQTIAQVMALAARNGLARISFVSEAEAP